MSIAIRCAAHSASYMSCIRSDARRGVRLLRCDAQQYHPISLLKSYIAGHDPFMDGAESAIWLLGRNAGFNQPQSVLQGSSRWRLGREGHSSTAIDRHLAEHFPSTQ